MGGAVVSPVGFSQGSAGGSQGSGLRAALTEIAPWMVSIFGDQARIRTGLMWRWKRMTCPPPRSWENHSRLRLCRVWLVLPGVKTWLEQRRRVSR